MNSMKKIAAFALLILSVVAGFGDGEKIPLPKDTWLSQSGRILDLSWEGLTKPTWFEIGFGQLADVTLKCEVKFTDASGNSLSYFDMQHSGVVCLLSASDFPFQSYDKSTGITFGTTEINNLGHKNGFYFLRFEVNQRNVHYKADVRWTTSPLPGANATAEAQTEQELKPAIQTESLLPKPLPVANATAQPQAEQQRKLAVQAEQARQQQAQAQTALQAQQIESPLPKPLPGANATTQAQAEQQRQQEMQQRIQKQEELARQQNERASQAAREGDLGFRLALANRDAQVVQQVQREKAEQARQERISQHQQAAQQEQAVGAAIGLINTFQSAMEEGAQRRAAKEQATQEEADRKRQEQAANEHAALEEELQRLDNLNDMATEAGRRLGDVGLQLKIYTSREELEADIKKAETEKAARQQSGQEAAREQIKKETQSSDVVTPIETVSVVLGTRENVERYNKLFGTYSLVPDKRTGDIGDPDKVKADGQITIRLDTEGILDANGHFNFYRYWRDVDGRGNSWYEKAMGEINGIRLKGSTSFILLGKFTLIGFDRTTETRQITDLEIDDQSFMNRICVKIPTIFPNGGEIDLPTITFLRK